MKFNKREKILITIFITIILLVINTNLIYNPIKEKENELKNVINKIEVSKKIVDEKNSNIGKKENIIIDIESYLKNECIVNYIKKESEETDRTILNIKFSGLSNSVTSLIENINSISNKIYLNNIELFRLDEENVECKIQITIYMS